jgi:hypothetical protein
MDVTNLVLNLKSKISDNTLDQQMISKAIQLLELGAVISVTSFEALPDAVSNTGRLYYVEFDGLYWSTGERWLPIVKTTVDTAWAWGFNGVGRLGDNTATNRSSPVSVVGGFSDWCQISAGDAHSLAVRQNGTSWAWGNNAQGRLGDGTVTTRSSPVSVVGGFSDWCQVSAGGSHSLAVRTNGTAWAWGLGTCGRLGDNTTTSRISPVSVVGGFTDWCQISAGYSHSLAVRTNGTAWAWGCNGSGRLGDDTATNRSSPVSVVGGFTDWCQISAGLAHSLAIRTNGTLWAWGTNTSGRLGDNTGTARSSPVSVVGGFSDWCQISAGYSHSLAVRTNGTAWAWGCNGSGRLGDDTATNRSSPVSVVGGFSDWCQISAGCGHSLAVRTNGTAWAWGYNGSGRLGDGTVTSRRSPVSVVGGFSDWCQISAGGCHSLAIRSTQV